MTAWGSVTRLYDKYGTAYVRTLGTTDPEQVDDLKAFAKWLRDKRKWEALGLLIDRKATLADAYDAHNEGRLAQWVADLKATADDIDLSALVTEWNGRGRRAVSPKYVRQVRKMIPEGQPYPRSTFTRGAVKKFLDGLELDRATKNRYRAALMQFASWLVQREILPANPVREVFGYGENDPRDVWVTRSDAKKIIDGLSGEYRVLAALMAGTGLEWQACQRLRRHMVDLDARTVQALGSKNRWRKRTVEVTEAWCWAIVLPHLKRLPPASPVFTITDQTALLKQKAVCVSLGIPELWLHGWRHSYIHWNLDEGMDPRFLKQQLGHSPHSTVLERVYGAGLVPNASGRASSAKARREVKRAKN